MPEQNNIVRTNSFSKGMIKSFDNGYVGEGVWTHAVNAVNNSHEGDVGDLGNEPANRFIKRAPYDIISAIHLQQDKWVLFSCDDTDSEIGIFDELQGTYSKVVNDRCLGFKRTRLITGATKENFDCTFSVYFADGYNPDRRLNLQRVPYVESSRRMDDNGCQVVEYTDQLDCEQLRLSRFLSAPSIKLKKGVTGGNLPNGSYQVATAYTINGQRVTDYFLPTNVQSLFSHENVSGSLEVNIDSMDQEFDEFELVVISTVNQQAVAQRLGLYSTRQKSIAIDILPETLIKIPLDSIPLRTPAYEKSDAIYQVGDYLLRVGPYTKPDLNYIKQAQKITTKWVAVEVPADYYIKGGNAVSTMRDEVYAYFLRWKYNTGEASADYPIVGREKTAADKTTAGGIDAFEYEIYKPEAPLEDWQVKNTATITSIHSYAIPEGQVVAEGLMGFYESEERYPDDKPAVWGDLCGRKIRHHRMPDNDLVPITSKDGSKIVLLGTRFEGITHPLDENGQPIASIVGYEILRASREGHRSIIAKGMLNNTGSYDIPDEISTRKGIYPNFPFNDVRPNPFLSNNQVKGGCQGKGASPLTEFNKDIFTFHSPETQFRNPFLNASELKIHGELAGNVTGSFQPVFKHPRSKLIRDFSLIVAGIVGVGSGLLAIKGKKTTISTEPYAINLGLAGPMVTSIPGGALAVKGYYTANAVMDMISDVTGLSATNLNSVVDQVKKKLNPAAIAVATAPGVVGGHSEVHQENNALSELPLPLRLAGGAFMFTYFFAQGIENALRIIKALVPYQQYGYQYNSHGFYNEISKSVEGQRRRYIQESAYLEPYLQEFSDKYRVNNLFRSRQVVLQTQKPLEFTTAQDTSRVTIGDNRQWDTPTRQVSTRTSAYYASLKVPQHSQYGQLDGCSLLPVSTETHGTDTTDGKKFVSPVLFGGDVYINRYTEKNIFPLFNTWMHDFPDGTEFDYNLYSNLPHPRYWINTTEYDVTNLTSGLIRLNFNSDMLPNDLAALDRRASDCGGKVSFVIDKGYFYLFVNGIRDFFVESEINLAHRDWGNKDEERHYDPYRYTDLQSLFRSDIIKKGNAFKYDYSLSASKLLNNYISWGSVLSRDYDPAVANTCYQHYNKRIIYSLPQQLELKKDNWAVNLANNYKDFIDTITAVKAVGASGAMIFFENDSPVQFVGVDQLQTDAGIKITVGDGGLFQQPMQATSNADKAYEYAACQNRQSVANTPAGLFWISQRQGKIFHHTGQANDITRNGMKQWFNTFLPSRLLKQFPNYDLLDNPVSGIGCQTVYDSMNEVVYFAKKDYTLKPRFEGRVSYAAEGIFLVDGRRKIKTGNPDYFDDASWTVSYDVKNQMWLSFHDWKPNLLLPTSSHVISVKGGELWKHNDRSDLFCNFYGEDYPFDVILPVSTGQDVTTLKSFEYSLECYRFYNDGLDKHHILDENFDRSIVYNSEQNSGLLRLSAQPKNDPMALTQGTRVNGASFEITVAKEEQKYRFSKFFDITRNRSEFNDSDLPMWIHAADGYHKEINPDYITYTKPPLERKKFRHYNVNVLLRKTKSGPVKMLLRVFNTKVQKSYR